MSKVGMNVTYWPLPSDGRPSQLEAALITAWDEVLELATLAIFPPGREYFTAKSLVAEGTVPGTFQQPASPPPELPTGGDEVKPSARAVVAVEVGPHGGQSSSKEKVVSARAKHHPG